MKRISAVIMLFFALSVSSCVISPRYMTRPENKRLPDDSDIPKEKLIPVDKTIDNTVITPPNTIPELYANAKVLSTEEGVASYYADKFHGRITASGEIFDMYKPSAAHRTLPLGTIARITNLDNGNSIILRINDRGPFVKGRIIDLSFEAAKRLGFIVTGTAKVRIEALDVNSVKK